MAGGIDWFRWHHGSVTDPKFQLVARRSGASLPDVLAVWAYLLEKASASAVRGQFGDIDAEALDCLFGFPATETRTADILAAMEVRGVISAGTVTAWETRQPKREREDDSAAQRKRAQRERDAIHDAESRHVTPNEAASHQVTTRGEESREEPTTPPPSKGPARSRAVPSPDDVDAQVWADWHALRKAKKAPVTQTVLDGARSEAAKAGMTFEAFLRVWCRRGTQGLEADWLKPHERAQGPPAETPYARQMRERTKVLGPGVAAKPPGQQHRFTVIDQDGPEKLTA